MQDKFNQDKPKAKFKGKKPLKLTINPPNEKLCVIPDKNEPHTSWADRTDPSKRSVNLEAFPGLPGHQSKTFKGKKINEKENKNKGNVELNVKESIPKLSHSKICVKPENVPDSFEVNKTGSVKQESPDVNNKPEPEVLNLGNVKRSPYRKKRAEPLFLSLEDVLGGRKSNMRINRIRRRTRGKKKFQRHPEKEKLSGNTLDSSNPKRQKGKHREVKKMRLTSLKTLILKERILKQILKENGVGFDSTAYNKDSLNVIDFNVEIGKYLKELTKKRIQSLRNTPKDTIKDAVNVADSNEKENASPHIVNPVVAAAAAAVAAKPKEKPGKNTDVNIGNSAEVQKVRFSSKFREYCENSLTPELNASVKELIKGVVSFQDRAFSRDPIKAKAKKRHVSGIKEVKKNLIMKKVKMVIIAPNLENLHMEGSTTDLVAELKALANSQNVPCVFALNRFHLGRFTKKNVPVSTFAVLNYEGLESQYDVVLQQWQKAREEFEEKMAKCKPETGDDQLVLALRNTMLEKLSLSDKNDRLDNSEPDLNVAAAVS